MCMQPAFLTLKTLNPLFTNDDDCQMPTCMVPSVPGQPRRGGGRG
jgi:hypothetical protein